LIIKKVIVIFGFIKQKIL